MCVCVCLPAVTGTVDVGHLSHPVLMHLRPFFDLWDAFTLQAVQSGLPNISDHIMFEVEASGITINSHFRFLIYFL